MGLTSSGAYDAIGSTVQAAISGGTAWGNFEDYQGSWANFTAGPGAGHTLQSLLGSWGIDTVNNVAWAVVDENGEFAVVPEPSTLALLTAGVVTLGIAYRRRRKVAKA